MGKADSDFARFRGRGVVRPPGTWKPRDEGGPRRVETGRPTPVDTPTSGRNRFLFSSRGQEKARRRRGRGKWRKVGELGQLPPAVLPREIRIIR